jgi:hypothetical protein
MSTRLLSILSGSSIATPKVQHYVGIPPNLTGGKDTRRALGAALFLVIEETSDGVFLYRYDSQGMCVGDTWHMTIGDAKRQASYEYEAPVTDWTDIVPEVQDVVAYGLARARQIP